MAGDNRGTWLVTAVVGLLLTGGVLGVALLSHATASTSAVGPRTLVKRPATGADARCSMPPHQAGQAQQFAKPRTSAGSQHRALHVVIQTTCGDLIVDLDGHLAPQSIGWFRSLAQHDYWADSPCRRLTTSGSYVVECGDPTRPAPPKAEPRTGTRSAPPSGSYPRGTVAMTSTPDTSKGDQLLIAYRRTRLPPSTVGDSVFGRVVKGLGAVDLVARRGVVGGGPAGAPRQPISILSVRFGPR